MTVELSMAAFLFSISGFSVGPQWLGGFFFFFEIDGSFVVGRMVATRAGGRAWFFLIVNRTPLNYDSTNDAKGDMAQTAQVKPKPATVRHLHTSLVSRRSAQPRERQIIPSLLACAVAAFDVRDLCLRGHTRFHRPTPLVDSNILVCSSELACLVWTMSHQGPISRVSAQLGMKEITRTKKTSAVPRHTMAHTTQHKPRSAHINSTQHFFRTFLSHTLTQRDFCPAF